MRLIFQSTCPARGTTIGDLSSASQLSISIHVPREGHDLFTDGGGVAKNTDFNPRAPRGARPAHFTNVAPEDNISIHVPREGHDFNLVADILHHADFNPRAPRGARLSVGIDRRSR